jgi:uncharacterized protein
MRLSGAFPLGRLDLPACPHIMSPFSAPEAAQMRVNIDEIKEDALSRSWDLSREEVDEMLRGDRAGYRAHGPAHVEARLSKVERRVFLHASSTPVLTAPCGRCLSPVTVEVPVRIELTFVPEGEAREASGASVTDRGVGHTGGSFAAAAVDEETYAGKVIDLDPAVREQILLSIPGYPVCRESCKGLCPVCGANLNDGDCGCDRRTPDPRWAGLEKFRQKS